MIVGSNPEEAIITGRKAGDNITLMNTLYHRGEDILDGKIKDYLTIVYKDTDTGLKYKQEIANPDYKYYISKSDRMTGYNRLFATEDEVEEVIVPYKDLERSIALSTGNKQFFYNNINSGNRNENRKLHLDPRVFNSDMNIQDHYRLRFKLGYNEDTTCSISKSFFDIEVDGINIMGDFPEPGEAPINAASLILQEQKQVYVFLLRNKANPQIAEFEEEVNSGTIFPELKRFVTGAVGGAQIAQKYNVDFKYNFLFYDEENEIYLIKDIFSVFNKFKPDFAVAWNMAFDIPYIIARILKLGYNPAEIMCHPDFKYKVADYYVDERNKNEFAERGDFARISSYTIFLDQMIHFASRRKGTNRFKAFNLDYIGECIPKVKKLDYKHITTNIAELPYKSYKTFVFYNIMDTIVQYCIEYVTNDLNYVFSKANQNCTRYEKVHRQTRYLFNRGALIFRENGFIIGNNTNAFNQKPKEKYSGAFVADPKQINEYSKVRIEGKLVDIYNNCVDLDYTSLYPNCMLQMNIAPNTQIGMLIIEAMVHEKENRRNDPRYNRAGAFMEDIQSQCWIEFAHRWLGLADYSELYHEVEDIMSSIICPYNGLRMYNREGLIDPLIPVETHPMYKEGYITILVEDQKFIEAYYKPDLDKWEVWRNGAVA